MLIIDNKNTIIGNKHPPPVTIRPTLRCLPPRVVGMPVVRAILRFAAVTPVARRQENDSPGMPVFVPFLFFLAIMFALSIH